MKVKRKVSYVVPVWVADYLADAPCLKMDAHERKNLENWMELENLYGFDHAEFGEPYFEWNNDFNWVGGNVVDVTLTFFED